MFTSHANGTLVGPPSKYCSRSRYYIAITHLVNSTLARMPTEQNVDYKERQTT